MESRISTYNNFIFNIILKILEKENHINMIVSNRNIDDINEKVVDTILKEKYMSGNTLNILKSIFSMIFIHKVSDTKRVIPYLDKSIFKLLTSFRLASETESAEGYALLSGFKGIEDMVIIKTSREEQYNNDILVEYFIGSIGTNKLRKYTPNFCYTLGIFECGKLPVNKNEKINFSKFTCKGKSKMYYIVYEKIKGVSLADYIDNIRNENQIDMLISYIIQIALALVIAQREISFCHYDLHTGNIMLRILPSPQIIEYDIEGKIYRIETDAIPTLIDFGFSHFVYNGIPIGGKTYDHYGIIPTLTACGFDLYKCIMNILDQTFRQDKKLFNKLSWLIDYYQYDIFGIYDAYKSNNNNKISTAFNKGNKGFFNIYDINSQWYNVIPMNFLDWLSKNHKEVWNKHVKVSDSLYNIQTDNLIDSYRAKIDSWKIFGDTSLDIISGCSMLSKDHKSYIVNNYIIKEFTNILNTFKNNIKDYNLAKTKINLLKNITDDNSEQYSINDNNILEIYNDELLPIQNDIDLDKYDDKFANIRTIVDIKILYPKMKMLKKYIDTYIKYKTFIDYSKLSSRIIPDQSIQYYHANAIFLYGKFEQAKSEYIFETFRQHLFIILNSKWNINKPSKKIMEVLKKIQYIIFDIKIFYPDITNELKPIERMIYNIALQLSNNNRILYVPPESNIQFQIVHNCKNISKYIYEKYNFDRDIKLTINDDEIYKKYFKTHNKNEIIEDMSFVVDKEIYGDLDLHKINYLDLDSCVMKKYSNDYLDALGIQKMNTLNVNGKNESIKIHFSDNYFSLITAFMIFHTIDILEDLLPQLNKIMKKNGILLIKEYDGLSECNKLLADIDRKIKGNIVEKSYYQSLDEWGDEIENYGFEIITKEREQICGYLVCKKIKDI